MTRRSRMFDHIVQAQLTDLRATAADQADRDRRVNEAEARLDEPLTRREVLKALDTVRDRYSVHHHSAFRDLIERIKDALS